MEEQPGGGTSTSSMMDLLPAYHPSDNHSHVGNDTIDVMIRGCFGYFDTIACVRNGVMSVFMLVTGAMCVAKLCRLHISSHPTAHLYLIFYCATVECTLSAAHWMLGKFVQLDFLMQFLKLVQFLIVSHLYWTMASRAMRKEALAYRVVIPALAAVFIYFMVMVIMACIHVQPSWVECLQPYWLALSGAEFALVQLFLVSAVFITIRLNEISTLDSVRREQKRDLWILVCVFEISSLCGFVYDVTLKILGDEINGCSGIFLHHQEIYSPVFGLFMVIKFLLPIWAMLAVFHPIEFHPDQEDLLPAINDQGVYTSVFTPVHGRHGRYKPMYNPSRVQGDLSAVDPSDLSPSRSSSEPSTPVFTPTHRRTSNLAVINEEEVDVSDRAEILTETT